MFGRQIRLKRFLGGIVVTAAVAVVAVPAAFSSTSSRGGTASATQVQGYRFITDTLGGNGHPVRAQQVQVQPNRFTSDGFAGNDASPTLVQAYNPNGYAPATVMPAVASASQNAGYGRTATPAVTSGSDGSGFHWGDAGIGAGIVAGLMLLVLLGGTLLRADKRGVRTA